jgi:hypothetical protein
MPLPSSGPISLNNVNVELGLAGALSISLNQSNLRTLFKVTTPGSTISMSNGYGKSRMPSSMQVLVVAGGGGSGAGGGGGGGVLPWFTLTPVAATNYAITIGGASTQGNGGDSQFTASYIAKGGGAGGLGYCGSSPGSTGGSGGGSGNPCRGSSGSPGDGYTNPTAGQGTYNIVQGQRGGYGRDYGNYPYLSGGGGGYAERGVDGSNSETSGYGNGYALDANTQAVPPFNATVAGWNTVTTHVGSGGGSQHGSGGTGGGGGGGSNEGRMYGAGSRLSSASKAGVVVVRYTGTIVGVGGNNITYHAGSDTSYHVFTAAGTFRFD